MDPFLIFDCDGILVDSESINSRIFHKLAKEEGIDISYEELHNEMLGGALHEAIHLLETRHNTTLRKDFIPEFRARSFEAFHTDLRPIYGIKEALSLLNQERCIASNGPTEKMKISLKITGIINFFDPNHIYSAYDISTWKPAPDLFLHAAKLHNKSPKDCIVIEDSMNGVNAAKNAGMKVIAYATKQKLDQLSSLSPDMLIENMEELTTAVSKLS